jgi:hypothetical protein
MSYLPDETPESVVIQNPRNRIPYPHSEWDFQSRINFAYRGLPANFRPLWKIRLWKATPVAKVRTISPDWFDMVLEEFPVVPVEGPGPDPEYYDPWYLGRTTLSPGHPGSYSARPGAYGFASQSDAEEWESMYPDFVMKSPYSPIALYDLFYGVTAGENHRAIRRRMILKMQSDLTRDVPGLARSHFVRLFRGFAQRPEPSSSGYRAWYGQGEVEYSAFIERPPANVGRRPNSYRWSSPAYLPQTGVHGTADLQLKPYDYAIRDGTLRYHRYSGPHRLRYSGHEGTWVSKVPLTPGLRYTVGTVRYHGMVEDTRTKLRPYRGRHHHWMGRNPYWLTPKDGNQGRYRWYMTQFGDRYLTD